MRREEEEKKATGVQRRELARIQQVSAAATAAVESNLLTDTTGSHVDAAHRLHRGTSDFRLTLRIRRELAPAAFYTHSSKANSATMR